MNRRIEMKKLMAVLIVGIVLVASITVWALDESTVSFFAYEAVTVDNTSGGKALTEATYTSYAKLAVCTLETAEVRYKIDGSAPTTTVGHPLEPLQSIILYGDQINKFRAIRTGSTSGSLKCSYGK